MEEYQKKEGEFGMMKKKQKIGDISSKDDDGLKKGTRNFFHCFPFKKNVYTEAKEIHDMTPEDVAAYRKQLQLDILGNDVDVPNPIKTWHHSGLPTILLDTITAKLKYAKAPLPIQAQALPVIMSGHDCIATGSGKILAFALPMVTHLMAAARQGAIGLVVAPTVDLVYKIFTSLLKFTTEITHLVSVPLYGGGSNDILKQKPLLKFEAGVVVGTPDTILSTGEITRALARVTFLVFYQADRMLDMGFETKLLSIASSIRNDRQNLVFSSTFNHDGVRLLARKVACKPVEIHARPPLVEEEVHQGIVYRPHDSRYEAQLEINNFPVKAIWNLIYRETLAPISKSTGTTIAVKGQYIQPPLTLDPGERKLYLSIEGCTEQSAMLAKAQLDCFLQESSLSSGHHFSAVSELGSTHA